MGNTQFICEDHHAHTTEDGRDQCNRSREAREKNRHLEAMCDQANGLIKSLGGVGYDLTKDNGKTLVAIGTGIGMLTSGTDKALTYK